jgi:hypothetical protein
LKKLQNYKNRKEKVFKLIKNHGLTIMDKNALIATVKKEAVK